MYYRKYFSGTCNLNGALGEAYTPLVGGGGSTQLYYRSLVTTPILCNAIVDVLREIGLTEAECCLDPTKPDTYGEIFPYGVDTQGIHVFFGNANTSNIHIMCHLAIGPDADINAMRSAASYGYASTYYIVKTATGTDVPYRFYVTVKGDPTSFLQVSITLYNDLDTEINLISFGKGKDCFGNDVVCYAIGNQTFHLYFLTLNGKTYVNQVTPVSSITDSSVNKDQNETIVKGCPADTIALIPWCYEPLLGVTLDNCYCVPTSLTTANTDQAFLIDGEEYWLLRNGKILARCPTKLPIS